MKTFEAILDRLANEPIAVSTALDAVISLLVVAGLHVSPETKTVIIGTVTAILALFARQQVTPTRTLANQSPRGQEGKE